MAKSPTSKLFKGLTQDRSFCGLKNSPSQHSLRSLALQPGRDPSDLNHQAVIPTPVKGADNTGRGGIPSLCTMWISSTGKRKVWKTSQEPREVKLVWKKGSCWNRFSFSVWFHSPHLPTSSFWPRQYRTNTDEAMQNKMRNGAVSPGKNTPGSSYTDPNNKTKCKQ